MFEIGWTEMLVIAVVMIVVVGPKDLPKMLRTIGRMTAKARSMAGDFQRQFNEALKEAELDDVKKTVDDLRGLNPAQQIRKQLNPFEQAAADVRAGFDSAIKPSQPAPPADPAVADVHPAEPLKAGATGMPDIACPQAMPEPPVFPAPDARSTPVPQAAAAAVAAPVAAKASAKASEKAAVAKAPAKAAAAKSAAKAKADATAKPAAKSGAAKPAAAKPAAPKKAVAPKKTVAKATTKAGKSS